MEHSQDNNHNLITSKKSSLNSSSQNSCCPTKILCRGCRNKDRRFAIFQQRIVGRGANSVVKLAIKLDDPTQLIAVKIIDISSKTSYDRGCQELLVSQKVGPSQNIVRIFPIRVTSKQHMYIFMEYCSDGTLFQKLRNKNKPMQNMEIFDLFRQLVNGYRAFQQQGILHEDIKPENVLVAGDVYKIADFGLTTFITEPPTISPKRKGTFKYMAPEKILQLNYVPNIKSDIYSLGILMYEVLVGQHPYFSEEFGTIQQLTNLKLEPAIKKLKESDASLELLFSLILKMVKRDESQRATWLEICESSNNLPKKAGFSSISTFCEPERYFENNWQQCYSDVQIVEQHVQLLKECSDSYREDHKEPTEPNRLTQQTINIMNKIIYCSRDIAKNHHHRILLGIRYATIGLKMYYRRNDCEWSTQQAYQHAKQQQKQLQSHKGRDHRFRRILEMLSSGTLEKQQAIGHFCNYARLLISEEVSELNHRTHTEKEQSDSIAILYFTVRLIMQLQGRRSSIEAYDVRKDISRMTEFIMSFEAQQTEPN